ncbi:MAG: hypothetical protein ACI4RD_09530 [Kiritimatiellia bacterium]
MVRTIVVCCVASVVFTGCRDDKEVSGTANAATSARSVHLKKKIVRCGELLANGNDVCGKPAFLQLRLEIESEMRLLPMGAERRMLVEACRAMNIGCDLKVKDGDFPRFEVEVSRFWEFSSSVFNMLREDGIGSRELMEFFLSCLEKYRDACFETAWKAIYSKNDVAMDEKRRATIQNLHARYQSDALLVEKCIVPAHLKLFPSDLHAEYLRRTRALLTFPTRGEMRRRL